MKSIQFLISFSLLPYAAAMAMEDKFLEENLPKPSVAYEDLGEETAEASEDAAVNYKPLNSDKQMVSNNPVAPAGVSISEFLEYGMVHVEDPNLLLSQKGKGEMRKKAATPEGIRKFYIHHITVGNQKAGSEVGAGNDQNVEIVFADDEPNETEEEDGSDDLEEEIDLSKLASRNKRG